jgi:uncharacterized membrane protein
MSAFFQSPTLEVFLAQVIFYMLLWLFAIDWAWYVTPGILLVLVPILVISRISEWLSETTPVPAKYFWILRASVVAPILSALIATLFII